MAKYIRSTWQPVILSTSPYFNPLQTILNPLACFTSWPDLQDYQRFLDASTVRICNAQSLPLQVVAQDKPSTNFVDRYAARIYLRGEMQTREENWHDFFQVITWCAFPRTKKAINARHYRAAQRRLDRHGPSGDRSEVENLLSLFDECGAIVVSDDDSLLQLIRDFDWKTLFYERRDELSRHMECILFGHAMLEKMFNPYIGMTANAILLGVDKDYFGQLAQAKLQQVDALVAQRLQTESSIEIMSRPKDLSPLPVLGFPGYWPGNEQAAFYANTRYFRPGRRTDTSFDVQ